MANQLYAKIKRSSKYYNQDQWAKEEAERFGGYPFPVEIRIDGGSYCVKGGPGGQYRLSDVNLFVIENGVEVKISGR